MNFRYKFPVIKGIQANKEYYIAMIPLKMLEKLFKNEGEYVFPEYRAQRRLNESRIPAIKKYILENENSYVFSALAASIDGEYKFIPIGQNGLGMLEVSLNAHFLINDGQHRKAAIEKALEEKPELGNESISVVLYDDLGLKNSQQIFTDLNKHAIKTSNSISKLYDSRDNLAVITRGMIDVIPFFNEYVDKERDILGKFSSALFTLNTLYTSNKRILSKNKCDKNFEQFCTKYWKIVSNNMMPWKELKAKKISKKELREKYIAVQAVVMQAFGRLGNYFYKNKEDELETILSGLKNINWHRNADCWYLRVIKENGRIINNERAIILATNMIKFVLNVKLTDYEKSIESEFKKKAKK